MKEMEILDNLIPLFLRAREKAVDVNLDIHVSCVAEQGMLISVYGKWNKAVQKLDFYEDFFTGSTYFDPCAYKKCIEWLKKCAAE